VPALALGVDDASVKVLKARNFKPFCNKERAVFTSIGDMKEETDANRGLSFVLISFQRGKAATHILSTRPSVEQTSMSLIQESWVFMRLSRYITLLYLCRKTLGTEATPIPAPCNTDVVAVLKLCEVKGEGRKVVVCFAYFPSDSVDSHRPKRWWNTFSRKMRLYLFVGCDANSRHIVEGSLNLKTRAKALLELSEY
jgi:hypothetical protein